MKSFVFTFVVLLSIAFSANAATYNIDDGYFEAITLNGHETLLMTGGGYRLTLDDHSQATILGTAPLVEHQGGIWWLRMSGEEDCYLDFSGGEIYEFTIGNA